MIVYLFLYYLHFKNYTFKTATLTHANMYWLNLSWITMITNINLSYVGPSRKIWVLYNTVDSFSKNIIFLNRKIKTLTTLFGIFISNYSMIQSTHRNLVCLQITLVHSIWDSNYGVQRAWYILFGINSFC